MKYSKWAKILISLFFPVRVKGKITRYIFERLWQKVWLQEGYATRENIAQISARHEKKRKEAIDLIITFLGIPVGTVRLIPHFPPLQTIVLEEFFTIERSWQEDERVVEVTLLTSNKKFRKLFRGLVFVAILRAIYRYSKKIGATIIVGAIDSRVYRLLKMLGLPIKKVGEMKFFEGSHVLPILLSIPEAERTVPPNAPIRKLIES